MNTHYEPTKKQNGRPKTQLLIFSRSSEPRAVQMDFTKNSYYWRGFLSIVLFHELQ